MLVVHGGNLLNSYIAEKAGEYAKDNLAEILESGATDIRGSQKINTRDTMSLGEEIRPTIDISEDRCCSEYLDAKNCQNITSVEGDVLFLRMTFQVAKSGIV